MNDRLSTILTLYGGKRSFVQKSHIKNTGRWLIPTLVVKKTNQIEKFTLYAP